MPQCGINRGWATIFTHVKIIFNISINKATDIVTTEILIPHFVDSAADVEACE